MTPNIPFNAVIAIHENDGSETWAESCRCTWQEFLDANRDGMDESELSDIRRNLYHSGFYSGGGGAFNQYELRLVG